MLDQKKSYMLILLLYKCNEVQKRPDPFNILLSGSKYGPSKAKAQNKIFNFPILRAGAKN